MSGIADHILGLHGWMALAIVFLLPALEASAFVGFLFPGEIAVLLGGVLAFQGRISLPAAIGAAILGAVIGDTLGYFVGHRWGRKILRGALGRLIKDRHLDRAENYLREKGGRAVFFGRFTAALRVLIPGLAGMSNLPYGTFLAFNIAGAVVWGSGFVCLGYFAGASWRQAETIASRVGLGVLALVLVGLLGAYLFHAVKRSDSLLYVLARRLRRTALIGWVFRRFPAEVEWTRRRLDPNAAVGLPLTLSWAAVGGFAWTFGGVMQDVVGHEEVARLDSPTEKLVLAHRSGWLTTTMKLMTLLGSNAVLIPLVVGIGGYFMWRRRDWKPGALSVSALAGAVVLYDVFKVLVSRARPPARLMLGHFGGYAFPSGHVTAATAIYGGLALWASLGRPLRRKIAVWSCALFIALCVGFSRIYLGAHWLTDVLGGYALGCLWIAVLTAALLAQGGCGRLAHRGNRGREPPRSLTGESLGTADFWKAVRKDGLVPLRVNSRHATAPLHHRWLRCLSLAYRQGTQRSSRLALGAQERSGRRRYLREGALKVPAVAPPSPE